MTGFLRDPEETLEMERDAKFLARRQELMQSALILGRTNSIPMLNLKRGTASGPAEGWSTLGEPAFQFQAAGGTKSRGLRGGEVRGCCCCCFGC